MADHITMRVKRKEVLSLQSGDKSVKITLETINAEDVTKFGELDGATFVDVFFVNARDVE